MKERSHFSLGHGNSYGGERETEFKVLKVENYGQGR